jgi:hypothetical protein
MKENGVLLLEMKIPIEDTGTKNYLSKAKLTSAEGCPGACTQQAQGVDHRSTFLFLMKWDPVTFIQIG